MMVSACVLCKATADNRICGRTVDIEEPGRPVALTRLVSAIFIFLLLLLQFFAKRAIEVRRVSTAPSSAAAVAMVYPLLMHMIHTSIHTKSGLLVLVC